MKPSGYSTMKLGGQERPFQVGTNQGEVFCRLRHRHGEDGKPLSLKDYGELFSPQSLQAQALTGGDLRDFVFSALVAGYENDGLRVDFTYRDVGNWIDDPGSDPNEIAKPIQEMLAQMIRRVEAATDRAKNAQAPPATKGPKTKRKKA